MAVKHRANVNGPPGDDELARVWSCWLPMRLQMRGVGMAVASRVQSAAANANGVGNERWCHCVSGEAESCNAELCSRAFYY
jgi:hypothetical protein